MKERYIQEILSLLGGFHKNSKNEFISSIMPTDMVEGGKMVNFPNTLYLAENGDCFVYCNGKEEKKKLEDLTGDELHEIYVFLDANRHFIETRENLVEHEEADDKDWVVEPEDIKGADGELIGRIGIAVEEVVDGNRLLSAIFISVDGTWATLTMWGEGNEEECKVARVDIAKITFGIDKLMNLIK